MFDFLRPVLAKERADLTELLSSGNVKDQYDKICGMILTIDKTVETMAEIEKKLATAGETDEDENA